VAAQSDDCGEPSSTQDLRALYLEYRRTLQAFFRRHRRVHADDLVQTVYLEAMANRPREGIREPLRYLFGIAANVLRGDYRRSARERARFVSMDPQSLEGLPVSKSAWSTDSAQDSRLKERLEDALASLPRRWQIAFLRSRRDGCSYRDIAEELHVSPHTVKKYIVKTLAHLRAQFHSTRL